MKFNCEVFMTRQRHLKRVSMNRSTLHVDAVDNDLSSFAPEPLLLPKTPTSFYPVECFLQRNRGKWARRVRITRRRSNSSHVFRVTVDLCVRWRFVGAVLHHIWCRIRGVESLDRRPVW